MILTTDQIGISSDHLCLWPAQVAIHFRCMWLQHAALTRLRQLAHEAQEVKLWEQAQAQAAAREEQVGSCSECLTKRFMGYGVVK